MPSCASAGHLPAGSSRSAWASTTRMTSRVCSRAWKGLKFKSPERTVAGSQPSTRALGCGYALRWRAASSRHQPRYRDTTPQGTRSGEQDAPPACFARARSARASSGTWSSARSTRLAARHSSSTASASRSATRSSAGRRSCAARPTTTTCSSRTARLGSCITRPGRSTTWTRWAEARPRCSPRTRRGTPGALAGTTSGPTSSGTCATHAATSPSTTRTSTASSMTSSGTRRSSSRGTRGPSAGRSASITGDRRPHPRSSSRTT